MTKHELVLATADTASRMIKPSPLLDLPSKTSRLVTELPWVVYNESDRFLVKTSGTALIGNSFFYLPNITRGHIGKEFLVFSRVDALEKRIQQKSTAVLTDLSKQPIVEVVRPSRRIAEVSVVSEGADWKQIKKMFSLRNEKRLRPLFRNNPSLMDLILRAYEFCRKHFPANVSLVLEAVHDREEETRQDNLFVILRTELLVDEAMRHLDQLELEWLSARVDSNSLITFDLEFL